MLAIKIWNYLKGYVIIRIEGLSLERLLNLALTNNIYLWDVKRLNYFQVEACVSPKGLPDLEELIRKVGCKEEILDRKGLPFLVERIKKRKMFVFGAVIFFFIIFMLSSFIWKIEIKGAEQTPNDDIISYLNENGISTGTPKMAISEEDIKLLLINEYDYFSFVNVQTKGVKLLIEVKEEDLPPEVVDKNYPANIVARKKGVITKVVARNGDAVVKPGQIVNENQVLISGAMENADASFYLVHADGEVLALTRYESVVEEPIVKKVEKETGRTIEQKGLKINNRGIKLIKDIPFTNYKEYIIEKNLINWDDIDFPIKTVTYEYREVEIKEIKQDLDFIKQSNQLKAIEEINKELYEGAEIVSKEVIHNIEGNIVSTKVVVEAIEEIGKKVILNN
jgi:similar to stage IV sporulation protein